MKKLCYSLVALCIATSCTNDIDISLLENERTTKTTSDRRTCAEAVAIANSIVVDENKSFTRSLRFASLLRATPVVVSTTRSSVDTVMYVVNYNSNQGFALIACDRSVVPVLAVIDEGSFDSVETKENEGFQFALNKAIEYVSSSTDAINGITPGIDKPLIPSTWFEYSDTISSRGKQTPRVDVKLGQDWPENALCPNYVAGCAPVGILQLMSGLKMPINITYTYPGHELESENINWDEINKHKISLDIKFPTNDNISEHLNKCQLNETQHNIISRIIREVGHRSDTDYSNLMSTNTPGSGIDRALQSIVNKDCIDRGVSTDSLFERLFENKYGIAIVRALGYRKNSINSVGGHVWIADAVWEAGMIVHYYFYGGVVVDGSSPELVCTTKNTIKKYIHYNWGWQGSCNGYFLTDIFNANDAYVYDSESCDNTADNIQWNDSYEYCLYVP